MTTKKSTAKTTKKVAPKKATPKQKIYKKTTSAKAAPKSTAPSFLQVKNSTYDIIKKIVAILPLCTALYIALAGIWGWGFGEQIDATITAVVAFLNGLLGVFMLASSSAYHKGD